MVLNMVLNMKRSLYLKPAVCKGSALFLCVFLTACQTAPTKSPVLITRSLERYVPIDPMLTAPCDIAEVRRPSEIAAVAAARKRALLDCNRRLGEIATLQGALSTDSGQADEAPGAKFPR